MNISHSIGSNNVELPVTLERAFLVEMWSLMEEAQRVYSSLLLKEMKQDKNHKSFCSGQTIPHSACIISFDSSSGTFYTLLVGGNMDQAPTMRNHVIKPCDCSSYCKALKCKPQPLDRT